MSTTGGDPCAENGTPMLGGIKADIPPALTNVRYRG